MSDVTRILQSIEERDANAAERLLPLVYEELRRLAASKMAQEKPGQTMQPTGLVHDAYLRLVATEDQQPWHNRRHFFAAAAEAMRRILVDSARRKARPKHGGDRKRVDLNEVTPPESGTAEELLQVHEALQQLSVEDEAAAEVVTLCYFAGLSIEEAAEAIGISRATAYRQWTFARAWLFAALRDD